MAGTDICVGDVLFGVVTIGADVVSVEAVVEANPVTSVVVATGAGTVTDVEVQVLAVVSNIYPAGHEYFVVKGFVEVRFLHALASFTYPVGHEVVFVGATVEVVGVTVVGGFVGVTGVTTGVVTEGVVVEVVVCDPVELSTVVLVVLVSEVIFDVVFDVVFVTVFVLAAAVFPDTTLE